MCAGDAVRLEKRIKSQETAHGPYALSHFICKEPDRDHDESCAEKKEKKGRSSRTKKGRLNRWASRAIICDET